MKPSKGLMKSYYPFEGFPSYLEIKIYLGELCRTYPHLAAIEIIGVTTKMAEIYMIKLQKCACSPDSQARDIVLIDGANHAREWLACSTAVYCINYIILNHHILDHCNYYIIPCLNVDGYSLSMEKKCYRLWRKNCALNFSPDVALQGVDLNRNFPIGFGMAGSSDDPSSYNYRGEEPLSEPESQALSFALKKYAKTIKLYISLHCYGNAILYPWSFTKEPLPDVRELANCAQVGKATFLKISGGKRQMRIGNSAQLMSFAAGTSTDYARYVHKIKFTYTFELQGYGPSGFTPHRKHIHQIGYEATKAILAMANHAQQYHKSAAYKKEEMKHSANKSKPKKVSLKLTPKESKLL